MELQPESFYEIELKSLLDKDQYDSLSKRLAEDQAFKHFNTESINTKFFKDARNDVRLRISEKTTELVYKKGLVNEYCRKEIKIPLANKAKLDHFLEVFGYLSLKPERATTKHKKEYIYKYNGFDYIICLQYIEDFAYILEVEYLAQSEDEIEVHVPNIKVILNKLELEVIDSEKFMERVYDYIDGKSTINYSV